jgi:plasmid stabilization system protein ParE
MTEEKIYTVVISRRAKQMLTDHVRFISNVSVSSARKLREILYKSLSSLSISPYWCPVFTTKKTTDKYRQLIVGRYIIVYSVSDVEEKVYVKHILDARQNNTI